MKNFYPKKLAFLALFILTLIATTSQAKNYYVSSTGNDANDGLSATTPWQTITKVNTYLKNALAGDSILFKSGNTFYGSLVIAKSGTSSKPIVFGAYGTGAKPVISGFSAASGWTSVGTNLWQSAALGNTNKPNMVVINSAVAQVGRYPNYGYRTYTAHNGNVSITDPTLSSSINWTGAMVHIREVHDQISRDPITSHSGTTISYTNTNGYTPQDGYGYFISHSLKAVDTANEWYFDPATKKITVYSLSSPANVKVATKDTLLLVGQSDYVTIDGISFEGANVDAISFGGPKLGQAIGTTIKNCNFNFSGNDAIYGTYDIGCLINNNTINNSLNNAIELENEGGQSTDAVITGNTIKNTGLFAGMGVKYNAIVIWGANALVQYNNIDSVGLTGVSFYYNNVRVLNNVINHYCRTVDDAGAINVFDPSFGATTETGREIKNNVILNGTYGVGAGTSDKADVVLGIYIDDKSNGILVEGNSVSNVPRAGFYIHNGTNITFRNNTMYNGGEAQTMLVHDDHAIGMPIRNIVFKNNILFANQGTQMIQTIRTIRNDVDTMFSVLDSNIYARPILSTGTIINITKYYSISNQKSNYTLPTWKTATYDVHTNYFTHAISGTHDVRFEYNGDRSPKTITLDAKYIDVRNTAYNGTITLQPYTSAILLKAGDLAVNEKPVANAGADKIITLPVNYAALSGTATDKEGTVDIFAWTKISGPATGTIAAANTAGTAINNLVQGIYKFELTVTDAAGATDKDTVQVTVNEALNTNPIANAGTDIGITLPVSTTVLNGSATDKEGSIKTYAWLKIAGPSSVTFSNASAATTTLYNLVQGVYKFELTATDNNGAIGKDTVTITVNPAANELPVANTGADQVITLPARTATLSGSGTDKEGPVKSYAWIKISGPATGSVSPANAANTTATDLVPGIYKFELTVTDADGAVGKDTIQLTVNVAPNQAPVANAGADKEITLPVNAVVLAGTGTDADGPINAYSWVKISGPSAGIVSASNTATIVINNLLEGVYQYELTITDAFGINGKDTVQLTVLPAINVAPVANAGTDQAITLPKNMVVLSGRGADTDGSIARYTWKKISGPSAGKIANADTSATSLRELTEGIFQYELTVKDDDGAIGKDTVQITVLPALNVAPTANAGTDIEITLPVPTTEVSGSLSTDPDGVISSYLWKKISGPAAGKLAAPNAMNTLLTALEEGIYHFELTVTDDDGAISKDTMQVAVIAAANNAPVANAGIDEEITLPASTILLSGAGTDVEGPVASFSWIKIAGPATGIILNENTANPIVSGLTEGIYLYELTITDNSGAAGKDTVQISVIRGANVPPVANAGTDNTIALPVDSTSLSGVAVDANGKVTGYNWIQISGPGVSNIVSPNAASTLVTGLIEGTYQYELTATDDEDGIAKDTVEITVLPAPAINLLPAVNPSNIVNGLNYQYYEGLWTNLPEFSSLNPVKGGTIANFDISVAERQTYYGFSFSGFIDVPADGLYTFYTSSDDGSNLYIDNVLTVINDGLHSELEKSGSIGLKAGKHYIKGLFFQNAGGSLFKVSYQAEGIAKQAIPASALYRVNNAPVANSGGDQAITLPVNTIMLAGSGADTDGSIGHYAWLQISGPTTGMIADANNSSTTVSGFITGVYKFELTVTDNDGFIAKDTMQVEVKPALILGPVANAGVDKLIVLPVNTTTLKGIGSVAKGTVSSYTWKRVGGASCTIATPNASGTIISNLVRGAYLFELTVKDNTGETGKDTVSVVVNTAPVAKAGLDKTIALPVNTITLAGAGSDAGGSISSYNWTKLAGPAGGTIATPAAAVTVINGLTRGINKYVLTVTDNNGTIAKDTVIITVLGMPVAKAGLDKKIDLPVNTITLTGSGSVAGGTISTYSWRRISGPAATIVSAGAASTQVKALLRGTYKFELSVKDNNGTIAKDTMQLIVNAPPVSKAGLDQMITLPVNTVALNGAGVDADGPVSSYSWAKISGPAGAMTSPAAATTTLTNLVAGVYKFVLTVKDNYGAIGKDTVQIIVNAVPVVKAGIDQLITLPLNKITLSGLATDLGGTISSYNWARISGPTCTISKATAASTTVTNLVRGVYKFELKATDNNGGIGRDTIIVTVNAAPIAKAGADQLINLPTSTTVLTGIGTVATGTIAYNWLKISGPVGGTIVKANTAAATITGLVRGIYKYELSIKDINGAIGKDTVVITVAAAPVVKAGIDKLIALPLNTVTLSGSATVAGGTISGYSWAKIAGPAGVITNSKAAITNVSNMTAGVYKYVLSATSNTGGIGKDTVEITVNAVPVAKAGADKLITLPTNSISLTGSGTDAGGSIVSYTWRRIAGSSVIIVSANAAATNVTGLARGLYKFELAVKDNNGAIGKDTVEITVNAAPIAKAGTDKIITLPTSTVTLVGSGTDAGGTIASYSWRRIAGSSVIIVSANAAATNVTGLVRGLYKFELAVKDNNGAIGKDTVEITVNATPIAKAGVDKIINLPTSSVTLVGSGTDAGGSIVSYSWRRIAGSSVIIVSANAATTNVTGLARGIYKFELAVKDNNGAIGKDTVEITVNAVPVAKAGADKLITLPTNSISLTGSGTDAGGTIVSYSWRRIAGSSVILVSANAAATNVTGLVRGLYKFELAVKDNNGAIGKDTVEITVNAAPIAKAGVDKIITLPTNSVTLVGSATDAGGSIVSYAWKKIAGSLGTIVTATAATTNVTGLAKGIYKFELSVKDDMGATGKDTVQITVNAAVSREMETSDTVVGKHSLVVIETGSISGNDSVKVQHAPLVKAGYNTAITLPVNTTILNGSITTTGATVKSINWVKIMGPVSGTIAGSNAAITPVKDLVQGVYQFELSATDSNGQVAKDTIQITVNAPLFTAVEMKNEMKVYPNPVRDIANVDITAPSKNKAILSVTDMNGRTVQQNEINNLGKDHIVKLDMINLRNGYYIVTVRFEDGQTLSSKVIKYGGK